ncbi:hypothetical protein [Methylobacterium sp. V23]|uniref:hypothetical protein n=1 Tax=Methylobacterium sp. V23 TaxID=2044878 RepID=UPI0011B05444|nr:hypothetical protein [Methylobacterium sp. V23]
MAEVHSLPTQAGGQAFTRLTEKLKSAFEAGEDLGSRASHIHALAETLERTLIDLDREVEGLKATLLPSEADMLLRGSGLEAMRDQIKRLISNARSFSSSGPDKPPV